MASIALMIRGATFTSNYLAKYLSGDWSVALEEKTPFP